MSPRLPRGTLGPSQTTTVLYCFTRLPSGNTGNTHHKTPQPHSLCLAQVLVVVGGRLSLPAALEVRHVNELVVKRQPGVGGLEHRALGGEARGGRGGGGGGGGVSEFVGVTVLWWGGWIGARGGGNVLGCGGECAGGTGRGGAGATVNSTLVTSPVTDEGGGRDQYVQLCLTNCYFCGFATRCCLRIQQTTNKNSRLVHPDHPTPLTCVTTGRSCSPP